MSILLRYAKHLEGPKGLTHALHFSPSPVSNPWFAWLPPAVSFKQHEQPAVLTVVHPASPNLRRPRAEVVPMHPSPTHRSCRSWGLQHVTHAPRVWVRHAAAQGPPRVGCNHRNRTGQGEMNLDAGNATSYYIIHHHRNRTPGTLLSKRKYSKHLRMPMFVTMCAFQSGVLWCVKHWSGYVWVHDTNSLS